MTDIQFDPRDSDLKIGMEIEYPQMNPDSDELFVSRGRKSNSLQDRVSHQPWPLAGTPTYDGTVGLEVVSDVMDLADAQNWYSEVIEFLEDEHNAFYQPTGLMRGGSTAGTHIHISRLSTSQARKLAEFSQSSWAKVLFCSSIASQDDAMSWPVFRGGRYVNMSYGGGHYNVVNERGGGHYEWRLPEPMVPEHVEILTNFIGLFGEDEELALEYAQELLDNADDRITSIRRAEAVGMDIDEMPTVTRSQPDCDPESFYETVESEWYLPEIYTVVVNEEPFYLFESRFNGEFEAAGREFTQNDVLYANTLERVNNEELANNIRQAYRRQNSDELRETEATEELRKIVKKKKGKL